jgi:hypothetical protein
VNCTLKLLKSSVRTSATTNGGYERKTDGDDTRFRDDFGTLQSIVTSSAQNDSGLFEPSLRDERYLPFEGAGAISEWRLELPNEYRQFDYDTISDVILHLRYTAREGGDLLRTITLKNLNTAVQEATAAGSVRLFSIRHEFPSEWARFRGSTPAAGNRCELAIKFRSEHFPLWSKDRLNAVRKVEILARSTSSPMPPTLEIYDQVEGQPPAVKKVVLAKAVNLGNLLVGSFGGGETDIDLPPKPEGELILYFDDNAIADLWVAMTWAG